MTTLPKVTAPTGAVVQLGHGRGTIENQGFNETSSRWHADHVYRHQANAILVFWLLTIRVTIPNQRPPQTLRAAAAVRPQSADYTSANLIHPSKSWNCRQSLQFRILLRNRCSCGNALDRSGAAVVK